METDQENRQLGFDPKDIHYLLLSHAHIDHSGLIPYIYSQGFRGKIYCTPATRDLCRLMLQDTAFIQAQDVRWYNKKMDRQHKPKIKPLFDTNHAQQVMKLFRTIPYDTPYRIDEHIQVQFSNSGHMLGSAVISLEIKENDEIKRIAYTGDVGRLHSHILCSPQPFPQCHGVFVRQEEVIGVFDLDKSTVSKHTREFLNKAEKDGKIVAAFDDIPNSFILTNDKVYLTYASTQTLKKRASVKRLQI